ncbi:MAG: flagellar basal body protein [Rhodobacteraceae bacterium]|nr:flagellar basal body protein [Paracoccaceae bacterium]MCF8513394.1 flagellar basal body protein [Paracoccaceae bacterium]MCF8517706.1 flagellar basal body protein [Paracoccaceae bacterium]
MSGMIDIARSGVLAYRTALSVTADNVANVNTAGYVRREAILQPQSGASMTPTGASTNGQGVLVTDVRRAFDAIASDRLRSSESTLSAATAQVEISEGLEQAFLPSAGSISDAMESFFGTLSSLSTQPSDLGLRRVVMQEGAGVASSIADAAIGLSALREDVVGLAGLAVKKVQSLLADLGDLNARMMGMTLPSGAVNPVLDLRDAFLTQLGQELEVNVTLDSLGRAAVRLGAGPGGVSLLGPEGAAKVTLNTGVPLALDVTQGAAKTLLAPLSGGRLVGQSASLAAIDASISDLNALAGRLADDLNAAHAQGIDLIGKPGGGLFALQGVEVGPGPLNRGATAVTLTGTALSEPVELTFDAAAGLWRATGPAGQIAAGADTIDLAGLSIRFTGAAKDGDRFTLTPRSGQAQDMRFVLADPRGIAAAGSSVVSPLAGNAGAASITVEPASVPASGLGDLGSMLSPAAAGAISLMRSGVVGMVPAGSTSLDLISLGQQSSLDWMMPDATIAAGGELSFTAAGQAHRFALPAGLTAQGLAEALNAGDILSADGASLAQLGVQAGGVPGQVTLSLAQGDFAAGASLTLAGAAHDPLQSSAQPNAGSIQVFTRSGRQIAGTPMTAADAARLLTEANGFLPGASYQPDWLNAATGTAYLETSVSRLLVPGAETAMLTLPDAGVAQSLTLRSGERTINLALPEGATAAMAADLLQGAVPGLAATAQTSLSIRDVSDGQISLRLAGKNSQPIALFATVAGGDLAALARAISAVSDATGISATTTPDGQRLMLTQMDGEDIRLSDVVHSDGGTFRAVAVDPEGLARGAEQTLGAGQTALSIAGQVRLIGASAFSVTVAGATATSVADAFAGGMAQRAVLAGGAVQDLVFATDPLADAGGIAADGLSATAASLTHTLNVGGRVATVTGSTTPQEVALGLAAALREGSPVASLTGAALGALPSEGTSADIKLDGVSYRLRMQSGAVIVEGPELGRLTASFGADNRLTLRVPGGVSDGQSLSVDPASVGAAAFGLAAAQPVTVQIAGTAVDPASLPPGGQSLSIEVAGQRHDLTVRNDTGAVVIDIPPGFPGSALVQADNSITLDLGAGQGPMRVLPGADLAGFATNGTAVSAQGGGLRLTSLGGNPVDSKLSVSALAAERLHLANLPPEELIVVMTGSGPLRLAGSIGPVQPPAPRDSEVLVTDPATGLIDLVDRATGQSIASGFLDAAGQATLGGYRITLTGRAVAGDGFAIRSNTSPALDTRSLDRLIGLAEADPEKGRGGFAKILSEMTGAIGSQVRAAQQKEATMQAGHEALSRKVAEASAVNLDTEAARMIELQQAYQASAQVLSIARQLFDTILSSM